MRFKRYRRIQVAEIRPVTKSDLKEFEKRNCIVVHETKDNVIKVTIKKIDLENGSPKKGDVISRNPKNHLDQWLISEKDFEDNFELIS